MALTQCSSCGGKLSTEAEKCPHCGITKLAAKKQSEALLAEEKRKKQQVFEARSALAKAYWKPFVLVVLLSSIGVFVYLNKPEKPEIVRTYYTVPPSLLPDSSKLKSETTYVGGEKNGPYWEYRESGELQEENTYVDGELDGPQRFYYESGELEWELTYVDGELDGPRRLYHENGELREEGTYVDGELDGPRRLLYHENGELEWELTYVDGERNGPQRLWWPNGEVRQHGSMTFGQECGRWYTYSSSGSQSFVDHPECPN